MLSILVLAYGSSCSETSGVTTGVAVASSCVLPGACCPVLLSGTCQTRVLTRVLAGVLVFAVFVLAYCSSGSETSGITAGVTMPSRAGVISGACEVGLLTCACEIGLVSSPTEVGLLTSTGQARVLASCEGTQLA